jgi:hypothetical protein
MVTGARCDRTEHCGFAHGRYGQTPESRDAVVTTLHSDPGIVAYDRDRAVDELRGASFFARSVSPVETNAVLMRRAR